MASSVCAFAVSPAPATSFISPPLYRTSRQWRCVYSARQQKEPVRRLRKGLARFVVVLADEESDVQLGISRKRPPIAKPTTPRHFSTASVESRCGAVALGRTYLLPPLSFGGASMVPPWLRFHIPLIEPDMQISRIRLSDKSSRFRVQRLLQFLTIYRS